MVPAASTKAVAWRLVPCFAVLAVIATIVPGASVASPSARPGRHGDATREQAEAGGIDISSVIESVRHHTAANRRRDQVTTGDQSAPTIAFDGTNYFVAWADSRAGSYDVYGARVSQAGAVLDPTGIAISTAAGNQAAPVISFDGTNYLVAWADSRSSVTHIYGARLSPAGAVLDTDGIPISTGVVNQVDPAVAFDGTNYFVVWWDGTTGQYDAHGARVGPDGAVLDPTGIRISTTGAFEPQVAFDGTNYLVVWHNNSIYGARVSTAGTVLDPIGIPISTAPGVQFAPTLAFDGTNYLVAWEHDRSGSSDIFGARVSPAGTLLDPSGIAISTAANNQQAAAIAFDGTNFLVAWQDSRSANNDIYCARVSPGGAVLDSTGIAISTAANGQQEPRLAFGGVNYLVAWTDLRSGDDDIYAARTTSGGAVLDPAGLLISKGPPPPPPPPSPPPPPPPPPPAPPPPPPPPRGDTTRPHVRALKSVGHRRHRARLRYMVWDNSGVTHESIVIRHGRRVVGRWYTSFQPSRKGRLYHVKWPVPRNAPSRLRFCVTAEDRALNRSRSSCAALQITS